MPALKYGLKLIPLFKYLKKKKVYQFISSHIVLIPAWRNFTVQDTKIQFYVNSLAGY